MLDSSAEQQEIWDRIAAHYHPSDVADTEAVAGTLDFLAELAGDGPALELAVGAGRIAVPLLCRCCAAASKWPAWTCLRR
ncbi:hypothetical protein V2J94_37855 [Streptomyces sp. DSM 41524]|uniref:Uncharacterized protein n=1 Tax=Streptomyces asiaticus subsp. ignotus TaxID=3098222 RepID=A0ABU7Q8I4_9ACTN|nr:hypothetical protein [Streptomyces sp. DSM 41524]